MSKAATNVALWPSPFTLTPSTPHPSLLATTTNTSSPQPPPTSRFDSLVGLTPSQHLCLNTKDHNHHQRVFLTCWWALLSLNLKHQPPPPLSHFDSLVGLTPSQHPCLNCAGHNDHQPPSHHHQRVKTTHWWVLLPPNWHPPPRTSHFDSFFISAPTYQQPPPPTSLYDSLVGFPCLWTHLPSTTMKNESFLTCSSSLHPPISNHHHQ